MKGKTDMKMKKFAALAAATIMTVSAVAATSAFSVFATEPAENSIVIKDSVDGREYVAYQIFDRTSAVDSINWGEGIDGANLLADDLTNESSQYYNAKFAGVTDAAGVAKVMTSDDWTASDSQLFAKALEKHVIPAHANRSYYDQGQGEYKISIYKAGYYVVIDNKTYVGDDEARSAFILKVVSGETDVITKAGKPTLTKEIRHNEENTWGVVGDNQIGDDVEFRITTTIPSEVQYYDKYTYTIHDQLSEGFDLPDNAECFFYDKNGTKLTSVTFTPVINKNQTDNSFVIQFNIKDLLAQNPDIAKIETYYSAKLNGNAKVADKATNSTDNNPNTAYLTYSNNPQDESGKEDGRTPNSKVYDWTFTLAGKKEDDKGNALAGAKFQLKRDNKVISLYKIDDNNFRIATAKEIADGDKIVDTIVTVADGIFNIKGIDDTVEYTLEEIEAPADYNKAAPTKIKLSTGYKQNTDGTTDGTTFNYLQISQDDNSGVDGNGVTVVNRKGSELPSTGGIGTQIFYGVGGAIVVGAGVLLITKKRAKKD